MTGKRWSAGGERTEPMRAGVLLPPADEEVTDLTRHLVDELEREHVQHLLGEPADEPSRRPGILAVVGLGCDVDRERRARRRPAAP